jgi:hypothetical protein
MGTAVTKIHAAVQIRATHKKGSRVFVWFRISVESLRVACETLAVKPLVHVSLL